MTGLVRRATLFTAMGLMAASGAFAGVPSAGTSSVGNFIILGGRNGTSVDAAAQKNITVRDAANNPVPNSVVVINFSVCHANDVRICNAQPFAGLFLNCAAKTVSAVTNASGVASFRIVGGAINVGGNTPAFGGACASVTADGVALGSLKVACPNENGGTDASGVDLIDTLAYLNDRGDADYEARSDMNGDALIDLLDTLAYLAIRGGGGSVAGCAGGNC